MQNYLKFADAELKSCRESFAIIATASTIIKSIVKNRC
jgi:hypothetical protein